MHKISVRLLAIAIIIAAIAAAVTFQLNRHTGLTLTLNLRAETAGIGKVYWDTGTGFTENSSSSFAVEGFRDSQPHRRNIFLPLAGINALRIIPPPRSAEIQQIILSSDNSQYIFYPDGRCQQQQAGSRLNPPETCAGSYPQLTATADSVITISYIPASCTEILPLEKILLGSGTFIFTLLGSIWLFGPARSVNRKESALLYLGRAGWLFLAFYYLRQFYRLTRYAIDVPLIDEWLYFDRNALPNGLTWQWLLAFHNEHRILPTKLMAWINLKLFGLDFFKQQLVNFALYGLLLAAVAKLKQRMIGNAFPLFPFFLFFLLSPINYENHLWGFQSQFHLVVIFALLALIYAFEEQQFTVNHGLFSLFILLAAYSFSAGVALAAVLILCQLTFYFSTRSSKTAAALPDFWQMLLPTTAVAVALACWFIGYRSPAYHPPLTLPFTRLFWDYFLNVISCAFGIVRISSLAGIICLALVVTPLPILWFGKHSACKSSRWKITAAILAILAILAVITMGRSGLGLPKSSRYTEFGLLLIPFAAIAWHMAISPGKLRSGVLELFWIFCACSAAPYWTDDYYRADRVNKLGKLQCVEEYLSGSGTGNCEEEIKSTIGEYIDTAITMDVHFTRQFHQSR